MKRRSIIVIGIILAFGHFAGSCAPVPSVKAKPAPTTPGAVFRDCPVCPEMVVIPAGRFQMGSPRFRSKLPVHDVTIQKPFAMGKYKVTFADWDACVADGGCSYRLPDEGLGRGNRPVSRVNRYDAYQYLAWLRQKTGRDYRLPSEAEGEYASRAGTDTLFPWGNYRRTGGGRRDLVGRHPPNAFGLHDTVGLVSEWVEDCCHPDYDGAPNDGSAWKTGGVKCRIFGVTRGGNWSDGPRQYSQMCIRPSDRIGTVGFRVAVTVP